MSNRIGIYMKVTNGCNLHCFYCYQGEERDEKVIDMSNVKKILDMAHERYDGIDVFLIGGEPLQIGIEKMTEIVELIVKYPHSKISMQSNFTLYNDEFHALFTKHHVSVTPSYDGTMTDYTRSPKVAENIIKYKKTECLAVLSSEFLDNILKEYFDIKFRGIKILGLNYLFKIDNVGYVNKCIMSLGLLFDVWAKDQDAIDIPLFTDYIKAYLKDTYVKHLVKKCSTGWVGIEPDGEITMCNKLIADPDMEDISLGQIDEFKNIDEMIYNDKSVNLLKWNMKRLGADCPRCPLHGKCTGGCMLRTFYHKQSYACWLYCGIYAMLSKSIRELMHPDHYKYLNPILKEIFEEVREDDRLYRREDS